MELKTCKTCGIAKDITEFYSNASKNGRRETECKGCSNIRCRERYQKRRDEYCRQKKEYYQENKGRLKIYHREYQRLTGKAHYALNKEKYIARAKVYYAVKTGKLIRPSKCSSCRADKSVDGHHDDYMKALDVIWLCKDCHETRHHVLEAALHESK